MSHDEMQHDSDSHRPAAVSCRRVLGALGGASAFAVLGVPAARAGLANRPVRLVGGDEGEGAGGSGRDDRGGPHDRDGGDVLLHTRLVRDYGIRYPIVSAGMAGGAAGGHNHNQKIPTLDLVAMLRPRLPQACLPLAAGGIADGGSLVRALRAGADGGWIGTRFAPRSSPRS